jgi:hypothetical protein
VPRERAGDLAGAPGIDLHLEQARAALDDLDQVLDGVEVEARDVPEAREQRAVSRPVRVVAPTSVKGLSGSWIVVAYGPSPVMMSMRKDSIAG